MLKDMHKKPELYKAQSTIDWLFLRKIETLRMKTWKIFTCNKEDISQPLNKITFRISKLKKFLWLRKF